LFTPDFLQLIASRFALQFFSGSLDVLNIRCRHIPSDDVAPIEEWKFVTSAFPGHPETGKKKVKFTQHCEITLALAMLENLRLSDVRVKKGVSKACCG
jgi:hypothetical protein